MLKKIALRLICAALFAIVALTSLVSCAPPKLDEVRGEFEALIEASFEINDILFGDGLSVYGDLQYDKERELYYTFYYTKADGALCAYYDKEAKKYKVLRVETVAEGDDVPTNYVYSEGQRYFFETDLEYVDDNKELPASAPSGYDFVRADERCASLSDISALASEVYSEDYLRTVFSTIIAADAQYNTVSGLPAKYAEYTYETEAWGDNKAETIKLLMRASHKTVEPLIESDRTYDYSTMRILRNSRKNFVTIEIESYGTYVDLESGTVEVGKSLVRLSFVRQDGKWRLDSPTY